MNMLVTAFLPLLLIVLFFGMAAIVVKRASKSKLMKNRKLLLSAVSVYVLLLLGSTAFVYLLPAEANFSEVAETKKMIQQWQNSIVQGELPNVNNLESLADWSFSFVGTTIKVEANEYMFEIFVEKDPTLTGEIRLSYYTTPFYFADYNFTHLLEAPTISLGNEAMQIISFKSINLELRKFSKEFTITQFTGENFFNRDQELLGQSFIHMQVPVDVQVLAAEYTPDWLLKEIER